MKVIFLGDVFGKPGRQIVFDNIKRLIEIYEADVFVVNGENLADGKGLTEKTTMPLFDAGVSAITSGNHLWDRYESHDFIKNETRIIKPLNYPKASLGHEYLSVSIGKHELYILTLTGQMFMPACNSPYVEMESFLSDPKFFQKSILVDFHAESTAEKRAFALMFDGRISAVVGTHTHIQTADEEILAGGTGYITDVGMTGPHDSIIGVKKNLIIEKMTTGMPVRYEVADSGLQINGVYFEIDDETSKTVEIKRIREYL